MLSLNIVNMSQLENTNKSSAIATPGRGNFQRNDAFFFFFINEGVCPMGLVEMKPEIARFVLLGDRGQADKADKAGTESVLCCHSVQSFKLNK